MERRLTGIRAAVLEQAHMGPVDSSHQIEEMPRVEVTAIPFNF